MSNLGPVENSAVKTWLSHSVHKQLRHSETRNSQFIWNRRILQQCLFSCCIFSNFLLYKLYIYWKTCTVKYSLCETLWYYSHHIWYPVVTLLSIETEYTSQAACALFLTQGEDGREWHLEVIQMIYKDCICLWLYCLVVPVNVHNETRLFRIIQIIHYNPQKKKHG